MSKRVELLGALLLAVLAGETRAQQLRHDPGVVQRFSVQMPSVASQARARALPRHPRVAWTTRVPGGIAYAPLVTIDGTIVLAHTQPALSEYGADGKLLWTASLGSQVAAAGPIAFGSQRRGIFTRDGEVAWFSARGQTLSRWKLPSGLLDGELLVGALSNGGLLAARGRTLVELDGSGAMVFQRRLPEEPRWLGEVASSKRIAVLSSGEVLVLTPDGQTTRSYRLGGKIDAAQAHGAKLWVVVDAGEVVELDTESGARVQRLVEPDPGLLPIMAASNTGELRVVSASDILLGFRADGQEAFRVPLGRPGARSNTRARLGELVLGVPGTVLLVQPDAPLLSVGSDGTSERLQGTACSEPLRPAALGSGSAVLACRAGGLSRVDETRLQAPSTQPDAPADPAGSGGSGP
ncbi:MAG TPA: hypothetical protein VER33_17465 [Polyangiaceae bacterium]|nr:hypothetical protein [Polyangiaceae bacterium]